MAGLRSQMRADGQSHQVVSIGKRMSFVEIVDTPDETAFAVAPRSEIFYVEIAYGQHMRCLRQIWADLRPNLRPAVIGGSQKGKNRLFHAGMFQAEIFFDQIGAEAQPFFEVARRFDYVHDSAKIATRGTGGQRRG